MRRIVSPGLVFLAGQSLARAEDTRKGPPFRSFEQVSRLLGSEFNFQGIAWDELGTVLERVDGNVCTFIMEIAIINGDEASLVALQQQPADEVIAIVDDHSHPLAVANIYRFADSSPIAILFRKRLVA